MKFSMKLWLLLLALVLTLGSVVAVKTGLARIAFYEIFALVEDFEVLGPSVFRSPPQDSPYERWLLEARKSIPVMDGMVINDVNTVALQSWPALGKGVNGLYLRFADYQIIDGQILQIPPAGNTVSQRQFYEKGVYFISGSGHTVIEQEGESPKRVQWKAGDLFSIPLNVRHQHFNDSDGPARLLTVSSFPFVINAMNSHQFIDENPFTFTDRYDGAEDYLKRYRRVGENMAITNFVRDARQVETERLDWRGEGSRNMTWIMAGNSMIQLHVSEMPAGTYKKAHRHSSDAFILFLSGQGFSFTWPEGRFSKRNRVDWKAGTLLVPPTYWYHQHLNSGPTPARYLAINAPRLVRNLGLRFEDQLETDIPEIEDAWQQARSGQDQ